MSAPTNPTSSATGNRLMVALGACLRKTRKTSGLTLGMIAARSAGRFKPSTVGGYERGERSISLDRFCELARIYGVAADRLLAEALSRASLAEETRIVIDLERLASLETTESARVAELVREIRRERGDHGGNIISLRATDIQSLAIASQIEPTTLIARISPALQR